jgi:hypothetical protein
LARVESVVFRGSGIKLSQILRLERHNIGLRDRIIILIDSFKLSWFLGLELIDSLQKGWMTKTHTPLAKNGN